MVLLIIFLNNIRQNEQSVHEQKYFRFLVYSNVLILILDSFMWLLDGRPGVFMSANQIVSALYFVMNPLICLAWFLYVYHYIHKAEHLKRKTVLLLFSPVFFSSVLCFLSIFYNLYFYFDANNVYHRGDFFYISVAISFFYFILAYIVTLAQAKRIPRRILIPLLIFALPPTIAGIIQSLYYGLSLIWPCVAISILIIYLNIQAEQLHKDYLTGLFNRRHLDNYLQYALQNFGNQNLAGIMIDINSFKKINDIHGHSAGDEALQYTADILKESFRTNDFIARYGGDEFIVLAVFRQKKDLIRAIDRLNENITKFNQQKKAGYVLSISMGYDFYSGKSNEAFTAFLKHLDALMYQDKNEQSKPIESLNQ